MSGFDVVSALLPERTFLTRRGDAILLQNWSHGEESYPEHERRAGVVEEHGELLRVHLPVVHRQDAVPDLQTARPADRGEAKRSSEAVRRASQARAGRGVCTER